MAVLASATATLLHEGVGHGVAAWLRGDIPTELTSNHLSTVTPDRWVDAGGTLINLAVGAISLVASLAAGERANLRYFLWIMGALNLLPGAGYFLFSGVFGFGDWQGVIDGLPNQILLRILMSAFGAALYVFVVRLLMRMLKPFCPKPADFNTAARLPYYAACLFECVAGAFDPLGIKLLFISTIPAAFGGLSGLVWGDSYLPAKPADRTLTVVRQPAWWIAAAAFGLAYIAILGPGIEFAH